MWYVWCSLLHIALPMQHERRESVGTKVLTAALKITKSQYLFKFFPSCLHPTSTSTSPWPRPALQTHVHRLELAVTCHFRGFFASKTPELNFLHFQWYIHSHCQCIQSAQRNFLVGHKWISCLNHNKISICMWALILQNSRSQKSRVCGYVGDFSIRSPDSLAGWGAFLPNMLLLLGNGG